MYYIFGLDEIIKSISKTTGYVYHKDFIYDDSSKKAYCKFINKSSVFESKITWDGTKIVDLNTLNLLTPKFYQMKKDFFSENSEILNKRLSDEFFKTTLNFLKEKEVVLYDLANFIIKIIFVTQLKSYTNGTTSETIGFSLMDFKDEYMEADFIELVIHQLIHMILFIDDYSDDHMLNHNKCKMIETNLKYKLGGNMFPAYLAFHSYIVGVEVLAFRKHIMGFDFNGNYHGTTKRIVKVCNEFKAALLNNKILFTKRGELILGRANSLLDNLQSEYHVACRENSI